LQEWFFLKLFSALEIGPKIKKILGFDLIFGSTCVEFAMEVCSPLSHSIENEKNLKQALKKMHALRIMHRDIKPGNMMWSNEFKRPVFIDFGGTKFIR
jgi:serine/threonine protein kinase